MFPVSPSWPEQCKLIMITTICIAQIRKCNNLLRNMKFTYLQKTYYFAGEIPSPPRHSDVPNDVR